MKHKIIYLWIFSTIILLNWCSNKNEDIKDISMTNNQLSCTESFIVNGWTWSVLNLKGKVINENINNISSNIWWNIELLNCEKWKSIKQWDLIAKIKLDYSDPNVQNLLNQTNMINWQINNTNDIIISTKSNFATQLNSLKIQKSNIESQLTILNNNLNTLNSQKDFWVSDIEKQLEALQIQLNTIDTQIQDLNNSKSKLQDSKIADIEKLKINTLNTKVQAKSLIANILLQVDELFSITETNKHKNDSIQLYLWVKDTTLKTKVESDWKLLSNEFSQFDSYDYDKSSLFMSKINEFVVNVNKSIKNSVASTNFPQSTIDNYYTAMLQYENTIVTLKNTIDNFDKSIQTVNNTYDTQILAVEAQINSANNSKSSISSSMDNIRSNKVGSYNTSIELQKNQIQSQIESSKNSLANINNQIQSLSSQEQIQITQLDNQLKQLKTNLNTISLNLNSQSIYSTVNWTVKDKPASVWNKVAPWWLLCQIVPSKSNLKLQIYSSQDLILPADIDFIVDDKVFSSSLTTKLPFQDSVTQNYIYETSTSFYIDWNITSLNDLLSEWKVLDVTVKQNYLWIQSSKIFIPIKFVSNSIDWSKVKLKSQDWTISTVSIVLWELDSSNILVRSWLNRWDEICK